MGSNNTASNHNDGQNLRDRRQFQDVESAVARIKEIYADGCDLLAERFQRFCRGETSGPRVDACYPHLRINVETVTRAQANRLAFGSVAAPGIYGTTITQPRFFESYLKEQIQLLLDNYGGPVEVAISKVQIPLTFAIEDLTADLSEADMARLPDAFHLPDLARIDDAIPNGTFTAENGAEKPLSLFPAERVDLSLSRLAHYTGTSPMHFQRFVLFTNYQRYVDGFIEWGKREVSEGNRYRAFVEPGNAITCNPRVTDLPSSGVPREQLPQMPAYHLVMDKHTGITLVNIGVGPSNAKTITDHIAVLRPHCWLMIGHCGGLRQTQRLGDYVLAHAYARFDHVLDQDLPPWVPVPPIAEVQVALSEAVSNVTSVQGSELKQRLRTGTIVTTDDRDWELRHSELAQYFNQSRAIGVDMESATIAANGFRLRVPYGTLLCVSDRPLHGEIKLPGMANAFYQQRVSQHLEIAIEAIEIMRDDVVQSTLHSRKLRSFDEPAFR